MKNLPEETLDPDNWDEFRRVAHAALDDSLDYLATLRERPAWQPYPEEVRRKLVTPPPREGQGAAGAYKDYQELVAPWPRGNIHPRFWAWVIGTGTPMSVMAEMLTATLNVNATGFDQASTHVELQILSWFKELMGFPAEGSGILVSGGSVANLVALNVARSSMAPYPVRKHGVSGKPRLMAYTSNQAHNSVQRALELMGLGAESLAYVPVDDDYRVDVSALKSRIAADRRAGHLPFCVVANAGTVNTGAVDDISVIADLCRDEKLWLHVDGAFGALAILDPARRGLLKGMERADSLAFDLHKWMYLPMDVGCVLVRSEQAHRDAFAVPASYLAQQQGGMSGGPRSMSDYGPQLSRSFRALKVWMNIKAYGLDKFGRLIAQNVRQAQYLEERVRRETELELAAPVPLNIVNFRYLAPGATQEAQDELNSNILVELQRRGIAAPSSTVLKERFCIRVAITNHRSRREDFDALVQGVLDLGRELSP
jgi:aromatic-L-amino-acid/L-tryptophan decarboxylase